MTILGFSYNIQIYDITGRMGQGKSHLSRIWQIRQTHKGGDMDQEDRQHESRRGELPTEPRMGHGLTYWRPLPEVSPDEDFRREGKTSINKVCYFGCLESN